MGDKKKSPVEFEELIRKFQAMEDRMQELENQAADQAELGSRLARELGEAKRELEKLRSLKQKDTLGN